MKILNDVARKGLIRVQIETVDDLWYASQVIAPGDFVKSKTTRKIKLGERDESVKKTMFLQVCVEKIVFQGDVLRIMGKINEETEDIPEKAHHTLTITIGTQFDIIKEQWSAYQRERLKQAEQQQEAVLIVAFDREEALFAVLQQRGYKIVGKLSGKVANKRMPENEQENFQAKIITAIHSYATKIHAQHIIVASPAFWKEELMKELKDDALRKKIIIAGCSSVSRNAFQEIMKRQEVGRVLKQTRTLQESELVEMLLTAIGKGGLATYGYNEVTKSVREGAVATLLVSTEIIKEKREEGTFESLEALMKQAEVMGGRVVIINAEHEAGSQLQGLGGIGALLRYSS